MIGPIFLRGALIEKFREHLLNSPYEHVIHKGKTNNVAKIQVDELMNHFVNARFPIVCSAGSKSSIPFWDYHLALDEDSDKKEVFITELLVREGKDDHFQKAILMAYYFLVNPRMGVEKIRVSMNLSSLTESKEFEDILVEFVPHKNSTYLSRRY